MIGISRLYLGQTEASDPLRYQRLSQRLPAPLLHFSADRKPVVVWNLTQRCNLHCRHCYAAGEAHPERELSTAEAKGVLDGLADYGCPVVLLSGGEPLLREDLPELAAYAKAKGLRVVISSNGTLMTDALAAQLKAIGVHYVGISLDGSEAVHDAFRGVPGAHAAALRGLRCCQAAGLKVGLRVTLTRNNVAEIPAFFRLLREEHIPRICFYHLVYTGRGEALRAEDLTAEETREALLTILRETKAAAAHGPAPEVLTVDNHADGPFLWLRMVQEANPHAEDVLRLLRMNGGNRSGDGLACISWDGTVYPDQFWRTHPLGNVREAPFRRIWSTPTAFREALRHKADHVQGRCVACRFLALCGGNFRARAEAATGDPWGEDPACYLTDREIAGARL